MAGRHKHILFVAAFSLITASSLMLPASVCRAEDEQQPDVANAPQAFEGRVNTNAVYVRSNASENFYATQKLDKGATVTVVGIKYNWLKILPPAGSFSYVGKAYIQLHGDGSEGTVTANPNSSTALVRAGSSLNAMKTMVQTKLQPGQRVKILGEQDEYFKIEPPAGAYLFIDQRYVDAVKRVDEPAVADAGGAKPGPTDTAVAKTTAMETSTGATTSAPTSDAAAAAGATTQPSEQASTETTSKLAELEAKFKEVSGKPLTDQPLEALAAGYQELSKQTTLPPQTKRIIDARLAAVKVRTEARESYLVLKKNQADIKTSQVALVAEREELTERLKQNDVKVFAAVGLLRTSSLQLGTGTLHRLTDPETGRTVVYIRGLDPQLLPQLLNQFVGVKGELTSDPQLNLKVVTMPTSAEIVDQTKVNGLVAAQIVPPSLLPKIPTASAGGAPSAIEPQ